MISEGLGDRCSHTGIRHNVPFAGRRIFLNETTISTLATDHIADLGNDKGLVRLVAGAAVVLRLELDKVAELNVTGMLEDLPSPSDHDLVRRGCKVLGKVRR